MSWYSDGEPFDEYDPPECRDCERVCTAEECRKCWKLMKEAEKELEEQRDREEIGYGED